MLGIQCKMFLNLFIDCFHSLIVEDSTSIQKAYWFNWRIKKNAKRMMQLYFSKIWFLNWYHYYQTVNVRWRLLLLDCQGWIKLFAVENYCIKNLFPLFLIQYFKGEFLFAERFLKQKGEINLMATQSAQVFK